MTQINFPSYKNTTFKLSEQVKNKLQEKGFSKLFNYSDYSFYKSLSNVDFNLLYASSIVEYL